MLGAVVEALEGGPALRCELDLLTAGVVRRGEPGDHALLLQALDQTAQLARVDRQRVAQGARLDHALRPELVEHPRLGERVRGPVQAVAGHAEPARVEPVEVANGVDVRCVGHGR
jgi:hypothetical protein